LEFLLRKALVRFEEAPNWWILLKSEIASLQRLDIPRFTTQLDAARILADSGGWVDNYLSGSGLDRARAVLSALDERDLKQNQLILRTAFTAALNTDSTFDGGLEREYIL
jgi:lantibiotic modifying enzyme